MKIPFNRTIAVRCGAVLLMAAAAAFGVTWTPGGFCMGDRLLLKLGLSPWSNGTHGIHYPAVCALILLLAAFFLFSSTTKERVRTFH